jgi:hypothetical protein
MRAKCLRLRRGLLQHDDLVLRRYPSLDAPNRRICKSVLESDACRSRFTVALPFNQTAVVTATGKA